MSFLQIVSAIFQPVADVIEHILPSGDARVKLQQTILQAQMQAADQLMDYEKQLLEAQSSIVKAEAQGNSWLQRSWRPVTMLTFLALVVADSLGLLPFRLAAEAWELLKIGLGGYVIGRSVEKSIPHLKDAVVALKK